MKNILNKVLNHICHNLDYLMKRTHSKIFSKQTITFYVKALRLINEHHIILVRSNAKLYNKTMRKLSGYLAGREYIFTLKFYFFLTTLHTICLDHYKFIYIRNYSTNNWLHYGQMRRDARTQEYENNERQ